MAPVRFVEGVPPAAPDLLAVEVAASGHSRADARRGSDSRIGPARRSAGMQAADSPEAARPAPAPDPQQYFDWFGMRQHSMPLPVAEADRRHAAIRDSLSVAGEPVCSGFVPEADLGRPATPG